MYAKCKCAFRRWRDRRTQNWFTPDGFTQVFSLTQTYVPDGPDKRTRWYFLITYRYRCVLECFFIFYIFWWYFVFYWCPPPGYGKGRAEGYDFARKPDLHQYGRPLVNPQGSYRTSVDTWAGGRGSITREGKSSLSFRVWVIHRLGTCCPCCPPSSCLRT